MVTVINACYSDKKIRLSMRWGTEVVAMCWESAETQRLTEMLLWSWQRSQRARMTMLEFRWAWPFITSYFFWTSNGQTGPVFPALWMSQSWQTSLQTFRLQSLSALWGVSESLWVRSRPGSFCTNWWEKPYIDIFGKKNKNKSEVVKYLKEKNI